MRRRDNSGATATVAAANDKQEFELTTESHLLTHFDTPYEKITDPSPLDVAKEDAAAVAGFIDRQYRSACNTVTGVKTGRDVAKVVATPFPVVDTLVNYKKSYLSFDISAGLVEGVMKVPMGLAYASLANMPSEYGLYTSLMPPFLYMLMGTCQQMSFGVTAIESILLADSVRGVIGDEVADSEDPAIIAQKVQYTLFFSFIVGLWQLGFRLARLQFLSAMLSDPVMSGFATGGAFIVATTQLNGFLGIKLEQTEMLPAAWKQAWELRHEWNWTAIGMGMCSVAFLLTFQFLNKRFFAKWPIPWQVPLVILAIIVTDAMKLNEDYKLSVVGDIPAGFPTGKFPSMPTIPGHNDLLSATLMPAFIVAMFTYVMTLSLGKLFARKNGYDVDASRELFAMGAANTISSWCGSFICSASFSRTAVVNAIGAKTVMHNVPALIIMVLALTTITEQLYYLPKCVLSAIVLVGLKGLAEPHEFIRYYCVNKAEFIIWNVTFWLCITEGPVYGIGLGVVTALLYVLIRYTVPTTVVLGRLPGTNVYRNINRFPMAQEIPGVKVMRFDASLNFANWEAFTRTVAGLATADIHTVIVDASSINDIDTSSMRGLLNLIADMGARGVTLCFANWKGPQRDMLERTGFYDLVKRDTIFLALHDAVTSAANRGQDGGAAPKAVTEVTATGQQHEWRVAFPEGEEDPETDSPPPAAAKNET